MTSFKLNRTQLQQTVASLHLGELVRLTMKRIQNERSVETIAMEKNLKNSNSNCQLIVNFTRFYVNGV
jgi:hypothetical protein